MHMVTVVNMTGDLNSHVIDLKTEVDQICHIYQVFQDRTETDACSGSTTKISAGKFIFTLNPIADLDPALGQWCCNVCFPEVQSILHLIHSFIHSLIKSR